MKIRSQKKERENKEKAKKSSWVALFFLLLHITGAVSSVHAVMSPRTSQGAVAWVISLNTMPVIALPAYWVLGRSEFNGYVHLRQNANAEIRAAEEEIIQTLRDKGVLDERDHPALTAAQRLAMIPMLSGNKVDLLINGTETFDSILEGISLAQEYILFQFFIVKDDVIGRKVQSALIEKAKIGVDVYFLYDEIGSHSLPASYLNELSEAGVRVHNFHTRKGPKNHFQINFRNHRKVVVVDGTVSWVGGHNVGDEYIDGGEHFDSWRDTHIKIEGPGVLALQLAFMEDWYWAAESVLELDWKSGMEKIGDKEVLIIPTGPADSVETATLMFMHAIQSANHRLWIASPYFIPDEGIVHALQLAALRGVDVRVIIPDDPDHWPVYFAAYSFTEKVGEGVKFYRYNEGFLHQKVMLIDGEVATVGTANFDNRSFRLNFEITAVVSDPRFVGEVEAMLMNDLNASTPMAFDAIQQKSKWFQWASKISSLFAPVL